LGAMGRDMIWIVRVGFWVFVRTGVVKEKREIW
jgi:hypothetical protein